MKISVLKIIVIAVIVGVIIEGVSIYRSLNYWGPHQHSQNEVSPSAIPFLQLNLKDLKEHSQALNQWPGKTLVINFWATWCEPCKEEMPMLSQLQNDLRDKQVQFVGIGVDEEKDLKAWLQTRSISYPILVGNDSTLEMTRTLGNEQQGIPFTLVISPSGIVIYKKLGKVKEEDIKNILQKYVAS
ncbi:thiol-disulfide oxidoreductase ResA [Ferrovum sp. JA12]|uniref:TlpA family protein disulfide reductase n=1 Tax=Ferrovum sp. JA12 TaxID=1356299 RepID=UPI0007030A06|nr:TlpA disulfide reductase family protein [Ferrovum sp. JA12]KRH78531.1 thiol-disulfide oxidoreductase ResA [Ferrovum sp. JA12]